MEQNIVKDGYLISPIKNWDPEDIEGGSFYSHLCKRVRQNIKSGKDWLWLHNRLNGEKMMASEFETLSKKFAVVFNKFGLKAGKNCAFVV